ncbi:hypothetical protein [Hyphococcus sp.]|uniref:hypothetical protein n=1 Tax=Hyphococcus sp. TaxID=2038636 RepID=UPI003CCBF875
MSKFIIIHRREKKAHPIKNMKVTAWINVKMTPLTGTSKALKKDIVKIDQHHTGEIKTNFLEASFSKRLKELLPANVVIAGLVPAIQSCCKDVA